MSELTAGSVGWSPDFKTQPKYWADAIERDILEPDKITTYLSHLRQTLRRAPDADRAALLGLVRELYHAFAEFHRDDFGEDSEEWEHHRTHDDCWICALLARADAALAGEPGEGGEPAKAVLLNALAVVTLLRLARGRMQHIVETAAVAMTHAEVRMTQDVIAQIDAAFAPEKPQEGKRG